MSATVSVELHYGFNDKPAESRYNLTRQVTEIQAGKNTVNFGEKRIQIIMKAILIISFVLKHVFDWYLDFLDVSHMGAAVPENVRDVYNEEEYRNWISYHRENKRLGLVESIVAFAIGLWMLISDFYAFAFNLFAGCGAYLQYFFMFLLITSIETAVSVPFGYYDNFVIEEKYKMNKMTRKTFTLDTIKSWIIGIVLGYGLLAIIMLLYERFGDPGLMLVAGLFILISLLIALIVIPLMRVFNRFDPLEEGELKEDLLRLCQKYGVQVKKIVVRDASRRTTRANAFCTGLFRKKTISLDDNLVKNYDNAQIAAVFAHEFAHAKFGHTRKSLPFSMAQTVMTIFMLGVVFHIRSAFEAFGFDGVNYYFAMVLLTLFTWPLSKILEYISNRISRSFECEADRFAAEEGYGEALVSALKKLNRDSLSNLNPHPVIVKLEYSHPTLSQRIDAISSVEQAQFHVDRTIRNLL